MEKVSFKFKGPEVSAAAAQPSFPTTPGTFNCSVTVVPPPILGIAIAGHVDVLP